MRGESEQLKIIYAARYRGIHNEHVHSHVLFQLYVLRSRMTFSGEEKEISIDPDRAVVLVKPGEPHCVWLGASPARDGGEGSNDWMADGVKCALDCKFAVTGTELRGRLMALPLFIKTDKIGYFRDLADVLFGELMSGSEDGIAAAHSILHTLLCSLPGMAPVPSKNDAPFFYTAESRRKFDIHSINAVKRYLDLHFREPITLEELVRMSCINRTTLCRMFKDTYGSSPTEYIITRRIDAAALLLAETSLEIEGIAERSGFRNTPYFIRAFKTRCGVTPGEYRRSAQKRLNG